MAASDRKNLVKPQVYDELVVETTERFMDLFNKIGRESRKAAESYITRISTAESPVTPDHWTESPITTRRRCQRRGYPKDLRNHRAVLPSEAARCQNHYESSRYDKEIRKTQ